MKSVVARLFIALIAIGAIAFAYGWAEGQRAPLVRHLRVALAGWPEGAPPLRLVLLSDIHVSQPDMPPARLTRIVRQLNTLNADAVLIAGDLVSDKTLSRTVETKAAIAPLSGLRARLGVYVVLGNHDHWRGVAPVRRAIAYAGLKLIKDDAIQLGPLILGGIDDSVTDHSDFESTLRKMRALGDGPKALLSHGTSHFGWLPPDVPLMLAGHDHCGQVRLPIPAWPRYFCGLERRGTQLMITSAGIGMSILPIRINAPPDVWVVTVVGISRKGV